MSKGRQLEPRIGLFCKCGAQWHGRWITKAADTIKDHAARCGNPISAQAYELLGHRIIWPNHWTDAEQNNARSESLKAWARAQ